MNEANQLIEFVKGNSKVIEEIYQSIFPECKKYIEQNSGNKVDAEDIFNDALIILYEKVRSESFSLDTQLSHYLFGIYSKLWLKELRKRKKNKQCIKERESVYPEREEKIEEYNHTNMMKVWSALEKIRRKKSKCDFRLLRSGYSIKRTRN